MNEREEEPVEDFLDFIEKALKKNKMNNRIEVMWDPSLADPEIHLAEEDLDEFLKTFSADEKGKKIKTWIETGANCERNIDDRKCEKRAVGSIDFHGGTIDDSVLVCREDVRIVYEDIMDNAVRLGGLSYDVRINGKAVPKPEPQK
jgi:hypothetical protein